ncbi:MAG: polyamine ABC transporter substrate-binding protein [Acidimicrobiia bacterium]
MKRLAILLAALMLLAASCSDSGGDTTTTTAGDGGETTTTEAPASGVQAAADACAPGETDGDLNLYNWTEYIPYGVIAEDAEVMDMIAGFEEASGVSVTLTEYESNEAMLAQIDAGVSYDVIVPSDYMVSIMKDAGLLVKLNHAAIPNVSNLDPAFTDLPYDSGNQYSMPYQWGTTGIGFSYEVVDDTEGVSWGVIFDPDTTTDYAGFISLLDDERETMGAALKYLGYSLNTTNEAEVQEAAELISATKDRLAAFSSAGYEDLLTAGETVVAQGWNGDFLAAYDGVSTEEYDAYEEFGYAIPVEGGAAWVDTMAVPTTAEHPCTAQAFVDYMLRADVGGDLTNYNYYASPNKAANDEYVWEDIRTWEAVYPPEEYLTDGTLEFFQDLGDFGVVYSDAYAQAKS